MENTEMNKELDSQIGQVQAQLRAKEKEIAQVQVQLEALKKEKSKEIINKIQNIIDGKGLTGTQRIDFEGVLCVELEFEDSPNETHCIEYIDKYYLYTTYFDGSFDVDEILEYDALKLEDLIDILESLETDDFEIVNEDDEDF